MVIIKKVNFKSKITLLCIILIVCIASTFLFTNTEVVFGEEPVTATKPNFEVSLEIDPENPEVNEDITVKGTIIPKDFIMSNPKKEIVLVLDVSGSMDYDSGVKCTESKYGEYCKIHRTSEIHQTSRLDELKKAAYKFIDTMKDVKDLRIGIVTYASNAEIKKSNKVALIPASNVIELNSIIEGLVANGGTNTGEGLRKAAYLLNADSEQDPIANKTLILMSDGIPTYYTDENNSKWNKDNINYYLNIDQESGGHSNNSGSGSGDDKSVDLNYAKLIGNKIKEKGYNAFSIGYSLGDESSEGNMKMQQIHSSMGGVLTGDKKTFFATDSGAIESVFSQIAKTIKDSYDLNNIDMKFNFDTNYEFQIKNNEGYSNAESFRLPPIKYTGTKISEGKFLFHAENQEFQFIIKGSKAGIYEDVFKDTVIKVPWEKEEIAIKISGKHDIYIGQNLPNIQATLESGKEISGIYNEPTEIKYNITAQSFQFNGALGTNTTSDITKDIIFLVDFSDDMYTKGDWKYYNYIYKDYYKGGIIGNINNSINQEIISKYGDSENVRFGIIGYNNEVRDFINLGDTSSNKNNNTTENIIVKRWWSKGFVGDGIIGDPPKPSSTERNLLIASERAKLMLSESKADEKYVIVISSGTFSSVDTKSMNTIKSNLAGSKLSNITLDSSSDNKNDYNIKEVHDNLCSSDTIEDFGYYNCKINRNYNDITTSMQQIYNKIGNEETMPTNIYEVDDIKLNFNLGNKLRPADDSKLVQAVDKDGMIIPNKYTYIIPKLQFKKSGNTYTPVNDNFNISFSVIPTASGDLSFGDNEKNNTISYSNVFNKLFSKRIETPKIKVPVVTQVNHGIYGGFDGTNYNIGMENNGFAKGSNVTFAGKLTSCNANQPINLTIDPNLTVDGSVLIYEILQDGTLGKGEVMVKEIDHYAYTVPENKNNANLIIIYNVKLPNEIGQYTNEIKVGNSAPYPASVKVKNEALPDLF